MCTENSFPLKFASGSFSKTFSSRHYTKKKPEKEGEIKEVVHNSPIFKQKAIAKDKSWLLGQKERQKRETHNLTLPYTFIVFSNRCVEGEEKKQSNNNAGGTLQKEEEKKNTRIQLVRKEQCEKR